MAVEGLDVLVEASPLVHDVQEGNLAGPSDIVVCVDAGRLPAGVSEDSAVLPGARAVIVKSITDLERLRLSVGSGPLFAVMSREKAKLSYRWMPAVIERWATSKGRLLRDEETGEPFRVPCCPDCTAQVVRKDGVPLTDADLNCRKHTCADCGSPLWQARQVRPRPLPVGGLRQAPDEGLLRPAGRGRGARIQGARPGPGHRRRRPHLHPQRAPRRLPHGEGGGDLGQGALKPWCS